MKEIITGLDLGSNSIKLIVGEIFNNELYVLSSVDIPSSGIKEGVIIDEEKASDSLKEAFKKTEEILGIKINRVVLTVPPFSAVFIKGEGYTDINREDKHITGDDITRVLQASVYNRISPNLELVSVTPRDFIINEEEVVKDPKGKEATRLTVNSILCAVPKRNIDPAINLLEKHGIKVVDLAFGGIADYYEFRNNDMLLKTNAVINIGEDKTEISIINEDAIVGVDVLDLAGRNIDRDIAYIYDITKEEAKTLKEDFALAIKSKASTSETIEIITKDNKNLKINQYEISEIVYSRLREILENAKKSINLLTKSEISYIIITGGSTEIEGFSKVYEEIFGKDAKANEVNNLGVRNNKYSSALGIIKLYREKLKFRERLASTMSEADQDLLFNEKKKNNEGLLGKVYSYFFDN